MYKYVYESENLTQFDYFEFGVGEGHSMKWWLNNNNNPNSRFYGFDTFTGLPESWGFRHKGYGYYKQPSVQDNRCIFIKGLFQDTLYEFVKDYNFDKKIIIHLDADLYSSSLLFT